MGAKEDFSSSLQLETSESIRGDLSEAKNPVSLYKKAVEVLGKMERNFDNALGKNTYDYFDGNVDTDLDKTAFEKKAQELGTKANELYEQMSIGSALYLLAQSKLGISSEEQQELNSLVQALLQTQETAKKQVESDLEDGKLDDESHIAPDFVDFNADKEREGSKSIIEVKPQGDHQFRFTNLENYNPATSPQKIEITDPKVRDVVEKGAFSLGNFEDTKISNMKNFINTFLKNNPRVLNTIGISDVKRLTPKQAIELSSVIVTQSIDYDYDEIKENRFVDLFFKLIGEDNDVLEIDELLKRGKGICRNYAEAVKTTFFALQKMQDTKTSQLKNTYVKISIDNNSWDKEGKSYKTYSREEFASPAQREIMSPVSHAWNTFYTVSPSGEVQGVVVDATWADEKGKDMKNPDYTDSRFLFNLERMVIEGLLTQEQKIDHLEKWCQNPENNNSPSYKAAIQEIGDYYLRQGDKTKGLDWYMKVPCLRTLTRIQDNYDISEQTLNAKLEAFSTNSRNLENVQFALFFAEYFYEKANYEKAIEFSLRSSKEFHSWDNAITLLAACIQAENERFTEYIGDLPSLILENKIDWMNKNHPKKAKIIIAKYYTNHHH